MTKVIEAMHPGVQWVGPDTSLKNMAEIMREHDIGAVPIGENDKLIGMVTDRDIVCRGLANDGQTMTARDVMSSGIKYCSTEDNLHTAMEFMREQGIRRLTVLDENKRLAGMLSLGDLCAVSAGASGVVLEGVSAHHA